MTLKELRKHKAQAQRMLDSGMTKRQIALSLGVHPNAITKLNLAGSAMLQPRSLARRLKEQGFCNAEIAKRVGVHHATVIAWVGVDE